MKNLKRKITFIFRVRIRQKRVGKMKMTLKKSIKIDRKGVKILLNIDEINFIYE